MQAAGLTGSPTGAVRQPTGGRRNPAQPPWAQETHSDVGSCSWARGRGKSQQLGLCMSKSPFQGLKWFPSECRNTSNKHSWLPHFTSPAPRNVLSPNFSARMGSSASSWHAEAEGPPMGTQHGTLPIPLHAPGKGSPRHCMGWGATTAGGRWWDTPGSRPPWQRQQKPAWSKATERGDRWRLDGSPGTGCRSHTEGKGQCLGLSVTLAAASSWQPPAWPAALLPTHAPPRGSVNGQKQPQHHRGQGEWGPAGLESMQPPGIYLGHTHDAGGRVDSPGGQAGPQARRWGGRTLPDPCMMEDNA